MRHPAGSCPGNRGAEWRTMPLTKLEAELRPLARARIAQGLLPCTTLNKMWGGPGSGQPCALCDKPVSSNEMEYEIEASVDGGVRSLRFHVVCEAIWQLECARDDYLKKHP